MTKQKKRTRITQSGKNYAINCAIQGVRLIWKEKIWLAIGEFLWSLTNQNAWFITSFCTKINSFLHCFKKKTALLLTNQNGEIFSCILLAKKTICKIVGVLTDSNLSWNDHAVNVALKISKTISIIARLRHI